MDGRSGTQCLAWRVGVTTDLIRACWKKFVKWIFFCNKSDKRLVKNFVNSRWYMVIYTWKLQQFLIWRECISVTCLKISLFMSTVSWYEIEITSFSQPQCRNGNQRKCWIYVYSFPAFFSVEVFREWAGM